MMLGLIELEYEVNHVLSIGTIHHLWVTLNRHRSRSQSFHIKYLECCERYNVGYNGGRIGNDQWASNWHHDH